jgi:hypothetical protein
MAFIDYPAELRQWFTLDQSGSLAEKRIMAQPAQGRPWTRRGQGDGGRQYSAATVEAVNGLARIWRFWREELGEGVKPFRCIDQQIGGHALADEFGNPITDELGNPVTIGSFWISRFVSVPREQRMTKWHWQISFELQVISE